MHSIFYAKNVSKEFEKFKLENVSFEVQPGSIVGVIGKNGCGKSTLLATLMGIMEVDSKDAKIEIDGTSLLSDEKAYKKKIAYVFNETPFKDSLSAISIGKYYGRYYDGYDQEKYVSLLEKYELIEGPDKHSNALQSKKNRKSIEKLSQGQRIRQQLAFALSYDADVYFFDEPTGNLDVEFRDEFYDSIREIVSAENKCVIYASHLVEEMENFADYILWIRKKDGVGRTFFFGTLDELRDNYRIISGEKELLDKIPKELIIGGRINENSKEILIQYEPSKIADEISLNMRYADLKEIMYFVEKEEVIYNDERLF